MVYLDTNNALSQGSKPHKHASDNLIDEKSSFALWREKQQTSASQPPRISHLDAFKTVYPEFKLRLCFFHLCQSVQKNIFKKFKK